ncbi:MAG: hypothetical protein LBV12_07000 [Puniceicoccales bacterium]|jgi:hypothetical protein|nr:hypothetical protein [Puniceicoccales bacterium]
MKKSVFIIAVAVGLAMLWQGCQREVPPSTLSDVPSSVIKPEENVPPRQLSNKEIPRREDRYFRGATVAQGTELNRIFLYDEKKDSQTIAGALNNLGIYGTDEAVQIMTEYLKENEASLPDPPPTKEELGNETQIKKRMDVADPLTPEGKILRTVINLIASNSTNGKTAVEDFTVRVKAKYAETDYGVIFLEYLDKAVRRGSGAIGPYEEIRKNHDL